jgi:hypothetical protein
MTTSIPDVTKLPTPEEFYLTEGLYHLLPFPQLSWQNALAIEFFEKSLDTYCTECSRSSVFTSRPHWPSPVSANATTPPSLELLIRSEQLNRGSQWFKPPDFACLPHLYERTFRCSRDSSHTMHFYMLVDGNGLQKIGQYPSLADIATGNLKNFSRVISKERAREYGKAVGLFAHGIGAGSFVYLRRVFEQEIELARQQAKKLPKKYPRLRMDEKILALKAVLPEKLVKNRSIYSILSKGIHELSEDECKQYFPAVRAGIDLILEEKLEKILREEREKEVEHSIATITGQLKS